MSTSATAFRARRAVPALRPDRLWLAPVAAPAGRARPRCVLSATVVVLLGYAPAQAGHGGAARRQGAVGHRRGPGRPVRGPGPARRRRPDRPDVQRGPARPDHPGARPPRRLAGVAATKSSCSATPDSAATVPPEFGSYLASDASSVPADTAHAVGQTERQSYDVHDDPLPGRAAVVPGFAVGAHLSRAGRRATTSSTTCSRSRRRRRRCGWCRTCWSSPGSPWCCCWRRSPGW